jgi:hypothetical protein
LNLAIAHHFVKNLSLAENHIALGVRDQVKGEKAIAKHFKNYR